MCFCFRIRVGLCLMANYNPNTGLYEFYQHRFKKLYLNYWFIWLIFVPIGIFVFGRGFPEVYGEHYIAKSILEFFGMLNFLGDYGYNPTWWFYSCIIALYLFFPFLYWLYQHFPLLLFTGTLLIPFSDKFVYLPFSHFSLPFLIGMYMASQPLEKFKSIRVPELLMVFLLLSLARNPSGSLMVGIDSLLCLSLSLIVIKINWEKSCKYLERFLLAMGRHSMNIFLFHTFIFLYWFRDFIYITRNPLIIFIELVISCYIVSIVVEFVKQKIRFYKII